MKGFGLITKHSCLVCIILATDSQNLGRLNRKLSDVLPIFKLISEAEETGLSLASSDHPA